MKLFEIFAKPIDRQIEGVIKADNVDDNGESLIIEVEEFVVTPQIKRELSKLLEAYNNSQNNGVWISGFFGSGKSHLLKMLALLFENRIIGETPIYDIFKEKDNVDAILSADLKRVASAPSESILFNIDAKADAISNMHEDKLLSVFVKVFNDFRGYYGKHGYIAQFEKDLDKNGEFEKFKEEYKKIDKKGWEIGRMTILTTKSYIASALANATGRPGSSFDDIIDDYSDNYSLSIEDFANEVYGYIKNQEKDFTLNFFVDEVGQYIADDVKLMTNLQTIAESLATKCKGRSWIFVTAQEEIDNIVGEMGKSTSSGPATDKQLDFSKIQARFDIRMKMTSQNVNEVIAQRLLKKNGKGEEYVKKVYASHKNSFGVLFDFSDDLESYQTFENEKHFVEYYPFIPYQFKLFQQALVMLSDHDAFEGKHTAVGERSMLDVFQMVAKEISNHDLGGTASFDLMFEGIRGILKTQFYQSILEAEDTPNFKFETRVLKALFLVKYVKGFKANKRNIRVLLQGDFGENISDLEKRIVSALDLLEQKSLIQKNGDISEYLTNEEKDVESEIKNEEIDTASLVKYISTVFFDSIIKDSKIKNEKTQHSHSFSRKTDGSKISGSEHELAINLITPLGDHAGNINVLKSHSLDLAELTVVLPPDEKLLKELILLKKTQKYIKIKNTTGKSVTLGGILANKSSLNNDKDKQIKSRIREMVSEAIILVSGNDSKIPIGDPKTRIIKGFNSLLVSVYPNMTMLKSVFFEKNVEINIKPIDIPVEPSTAQKEILSFVQRNQGSGIQTTMRSVDRNFSKKPFGWYLAATQNLVALLSANGKILVKDDSNVLQGADLVAGIIKTYGYDNIYIIPNIDVTVRTLNKFKRFYEDLFEKPIAGSNAQTLANDFQAALNFILEKLKKIYGQYMRYPFLFVIGDVIHHLEGLENKDFHYIASISDEEKDSYLSEKTDVSDRIIRFMNGSQKDIYDDALAFVQKYGANFSSLKGGEADEIQSILQDKECYTGNNMKRAKELIGSLTMKIEGSIQKTLKEALLKIMSLQEDAEKKDGFKDLSDEYKEQIVSPFRSTENELKSKATVSGIRDRVSQFEKYEFIDILDKISELSKPEEKVIKTVRLTDLELIFDKNTLTDKEDVEQYLEALKKALLSIIDDKEIRL